MVSSASSPLPPPDKKLGKAINNDRVHAFRQTYRYFRTGEAKGAKGEVDQFRIETGLENFPLNREALESETFATVESANAEVYNAVTNYRLSYARFRQGGSQGAKGEVSAVTRIMTMEHARSMPVAQRAKLLKREQREAHPDTKFHLHFGGGRLGLGLLSPAIAKAHDTGIPFALVDAPFGDYDDLVKRGHKTVSFFVNGEPTIQNVLLITKEEQLPENLLDPKTALFLCTTDTKLVNKVLAIATTVSTSLGPVMPKVVCPYFEKPTDKFIYCCENDHGMVEKLGETLEGKATVVTCMVDRICTGRTVEEDKVYTTSEPHLGEIVILNPPLGAPLPAFKGPNVMAPDSQATADYFCRRKIGLVNGMHTTLAFMSLLQECKGDTAEDVDLLAPEKASEEQQQMIRDFMVVRLLLVLYEHDTSVIKHAHNVKTDEEVARVLLDYGESTLKRYNTIQDKTSRVLGGGVANRWSTRLCNVKQFLDAHPQLGGISKRLLRMANVDEKHVRASVDKLVKDSEKFVGQKPTWEANK
ncbi:mannitol 1-phosphate dehydrogenase [Tribonema minus]|uniref:Mannitol 1-phosphate dehydrogenase n=1 Tax=Tribonema minus TaxID=303371 RepID=A0A836CC36_9STRA|nr:mannitol 1-phosphate dehydrogenase [Tribonema minus]